MKRSRLLILLFFSLLFIGCDDDVAVLTDEAFHSFRFEEPGTEGGNPVEATTLEEVKEKFPKYSQEFASHRKGDSAIPSYRNHVVLVYRTRNGNFYLQFEDNKLIYKRKYQPRTS